MTAKTWDYNVSLDLALGHFLIQDLVAEIDSPRFDNAAVDGYALHALSLASGSATLAFEVQAGAVPTRPLFEGEAARIFTGAQLPFGAEAVVMQEDCQVDGAVLTFPHGVSPGQHIRRKGEDFAAGSTVLNAGTMLGPIQVGIAASSGRTTVVTRLKPRVRILTTGNEVAPMGKRELGDALIPNSNAYALMSALQALNIRPEVRHAKDHKEELVSTLKELLHGCDILITCGGVSVGTYDYLKEAFAELGVQQRFWGVSIKPGKPIYFGIRDRQLVFGLPGNPVSALVTFYLFARPAILKMMGHPNPWPKPFKARFEGECCKQPGRMEFLRGVLSEGTVALAGEQGSHQMAALAAADCLIHFPLEATELQTGEIVEVTPLNWGIT